jgi:hypothetical protein
MAQARMSQMMKEYKIKIGKKVNSDQEDSAFCEHFDME